MQNDIELDSKFTKGRSIFRHISVKLICITFLAVVPINILAVTVSQIISNFYQNKLIDSYGNQLNQSVKDMDTNIQYWDNAIRKLLSAENNFQTRCYCLHV